MRLSGWLTRKVVTSDTCLFKIIHACIQRAKAALECETVLLNMRTVTKDQNQ